MKSTSILYVYMCVRVCVIYVWQTICSLILSQFSENRLVWRKQKRLSKNFQHSYLSIYNLPFLLLICNQCHCFYLPNNGFCWWTKWNLWMVYTSQLSNHKTPMHVIRTWDEDRKTKNRARINAQNFIWRLTNIYGFWILSTRHTYNDLRYCLVHVPSDNIK